VVKIRTKGEAGATGGRYLTPPGQVKMAKVLNVMSVDVEEWYHPEALRGYVDPAAMSARSTRVEGQMAPLLDLFDEAGVRATFFVLGQVAQAHPGLLRRLVERGHEVASHGQGHQMITDQNPDEFRRDLLEARRILEDATGQPVRGYRAPTFSVVDKTRWALDIIAETGHCYDASIYPIRHDRYGIPDSPRFPYRHRSGLVELPGSTVRLWRTNLPVGGGGYLRLFPLWFNLHALRHINEQEGQPFVVYFHPWETDPTLPRVRLPVLRSWRNYNNIDIMVDRLRLLLARFSFATATEVLAQRGLLAAGVE
jgi:polysaccharide deacetylase family protein (PEP-CTERM system associated)